MMQNKRVPLFECFPPPFLALGVIMVVTARGLSNDDAPRMRAPPPPGTGGLVIHNGIPSLLTAWYTGVCVGLWLLLVRLMGSSVTSSCRS